jgi:hypothetical protein
MTHSADATTAVKQAGLTYAKPEFLSLKDHPQFNEYWVQEKLAEDPSLLGLGDLVLKDKERIHPQKGRQTCCSSTRMRRIATKSKLS